MKPWEIWLASFPYEEDASIEKSRPVIVLNVEPLEVLCVKVTRHSARTNDPYDIPIVKWSEAKLRSPSVARVSKNIILDSDKLIHLIGELHVDDIQAIYNKYIECVNNTSLIDAQN